MKIVKQGRQRLFEQDRETAAIVTEMLLELERDGMDAVRRYSRKFDDWAPAEFRLTPAQVSEAIARLPEQAIRDTDYCQNNVRHFAQAQMATMTPLEVETRPGVILGHRHIPVNSVGSYVPGGRYPMFGSAQMSIIPARVAGVKNIVAATPPVKGEGWYPATINAIQKAGADQIYILGGVPALAVMAFGLDGIEPVDVLCGAGNRFVAEAKRQLFGRCGIDLLAGPTEILVIADESADPSLVACDLLGQAEHDPNSGVCLICLSEQFAHRAIAELEKQLAVLPTREIAALAWRDQGCVWVADDQDEAVRLSDRYAPEHLELHVADVDFFFGRLTNYGSLFIGEETTVAYGDKTIGTNHILPTSRAARYTGGVWVGKFLKTCTYQRMTPAASVEVGEVTERQCNLEHMLAHAITARVRVDRYGTKSVAPERSLGLDVLIVILALAFLVFMAYRGFSVILFAPVAALLAVLCTSPALVLPFYSGVFMDKLAGFVKLYFPMFLLGSVFGKLIELSGFADSLVRGILRLVGPRRAILSVILVCAVLTYGGVSLFVVVFAVYPFAAELYRKAEIPKRLLPATIALGAFTFTMDALPGTPQVQNLIPTAFFHTDAWAAPRMGIVASLFIFGSGLAYLEWRLRMARRAGEGYGSGHINEPVLVTDASVPPALLAVIPLVAVGVLNLLLASWIRGTYQPSFPLGRFAPGAEPLEIDRFRAVWSVEGALLVAILFVLPFALRRSRTTVPSGLNAAVSGAMLAAMNVASEYGFGGVIAILPGFHAVQAAMGRAISNPLLNIAATTNVLAAVTGSSSGGLSITLGALGRQYLETARAAGIPLEVVHRVATMASGGMDTLPHNGAIITLLAITGLTHRQAYKDIFAMTGIKVAAVFVGLGFYLLTGTY